MGPYCWPPDTLSDEAYILTEELYRSHKRSEKHPPIGIEIPDFSKGIDICACSSFEQLVDWFGKTRIGDFSKLPEEEYVVAVYTVPNTHVKYGSNQCAFNKWAAISRAKVPGKEIRKLLKQC